MGECFTCFLHTGFRHPLLPHNVHEHKDGKIIFKHSLEDRVKGDLDESEHQSQYVYFGITPFHAEGTTLAKIVERSGRV